MWGVHVAWAWREERVVAAVMKEPALLSEIPELTPEEFSAPILSKVFSQQLQRHKEGQDATLTGLTDFSSEELAHIAGILQRYDDPVNAQALRDCARTIRMEHQTNKVRTEEDIMAMIKEDLCIEILPIREEHIRTYARLTINENQGHFDPSDHIIIAHAITERMPLISSDHKFDFYIPQGLDYICNS